MLKNNIEIDVKVKCVEEQTTQAELAEKVGTSPSYVNRLIKSPEKIINATYIKMLEQLGYDIELTYGTGFDVCKAVRNSSTVPIIFLTASDQEISIVRGLDMGADDYITKPFKLNELLSRIKAILRRSLQFSKADTFLEANGVRVDTAERLVWKNEKPLDLPLVEYKLLCLFMQNPNHLMSREMILDRMWDGNGNFVDDNTLSVYIRRLRNKIEDTPNQPKYLLTERGIGYKWVVE